MRKKKVWGVFLFTSKKRWRHSANYPRLHKKKSDALWDVVLAPKWVPYTAIPGTILPDGSIAWPKEWPVP